MKKYALFGLAFLMTACSTASLSSSGSRVEYVNALDRKGCKNLGSVFGKGGGQFGGAWISDEKLMEYAVNDIRNKAGEKGATHVVAQTHQMGNTSSAGYYGGGGTTSTATISGVAFRCPRDEE